LDIKPGVAAGKLAWASSLPLSKGGVIAVGNIQNGTTGSGYQVGNGQHPHKALGSIPLIGF